MPSKKFRPMGGVAAEPGYPLPVLISPKLDGIRCVVLDGVAMSRNVKPIRNQFIQACLAGLPPLDGELIVGDPTSPVVWNSSNSGVMSRDGEPDFVFHVFDHYHEKDEFAQRYETAKNIVADLDVPYIKMVEHHPCHTYDDVDQYESAYVEAGYEGAMIRSPYGPYKFGKSTAAEGFLLKIKRVQDAEAEVIAIERLYVNANEKEVNEVGLTKRAKKAEHLIPCDLMGAFLVRDLTTGKEFSIGSGFDAAQRVQFWERPPTGRIITYKFNGLTNNGLPRFPIFKGFRDKDDMVSA